MATPLLQATCLPPRQEGAQTMRRVLRVSPLPNRAFDKSRLRQLGFRSGDSAPLEGRLLLRLRRFVLNLIQPRGRSANRCIPSIVGMFALRPLKRRCRRWGMPKKKAAQQRKRRRSPPWGKLFGGKPIERLAFIRGEKVDLGDDLAQRTRYSRMMSLLNHYGIVADRKSVV